MLGCAAEFEKVFRHHTDIALTAEKSASWVAQSSIRLFRQSPQIPTVQSQHGLSLPEPDSPCWLAVDWTSR